MSGLLDRIHLRSREKTANAPVEPRATDAQRARRASESGALANGLAGLLGSVDELLFVVDTAGRFAAASRRLLHVLGMREQDILGRAAGDVFADAASLIANGSTGRVRFRSSSGTCNAATLTVSIIPVGNACAVRVGILTQLSEERSGAEATPFDGAVKARLKAGDAPYQLTAGRIELISLAEVKAALGNRWPAQAAQAKSIAKSVIAKRLAAEDMFTELENDSFVICYSSLDIAEARIKSELIAREIRERLLGESSQAFTIVAQVEKVELKEAEVAGDIDLVKTLINQLDEARIERSHATAMSVNELLKKATLLLSSVLTRSLAPTGVMIAGVGGDRLPCLSNIGSSYDDLKMVFDLDSLLLGLVLRYVYQTVSEGRAASIVVPVNYTTLHERKFSQEYIKLCRLCSR